MKVYKEIEIPAKKELEFISLSCDFCGRTTKLDSWGFKSYEINDTLVQITMHRVTGQSYPSGGFQEKKEIDICPACWDEHMDPFLKSKGVDPEIVESEW